MPLHADSRYLPWSTRLKSWVIVLEAAELTLPASSFTSPDLVVKGSVLLVEDIATFSSFFTPFVAFSALLFSALNNPGLSPAQAAEIGSRGTSEAKASEASLRENVSCLDSTQKEA